MTSSDPPRPSWSELVAVYLSWSMAAMLVLGFASGLPLMMVFSKLSFWLREVGVDRSVIGGFYAVSLAYSLKVFWAPFVDRLRLPVLTAALGQRRSWMLLAISGTVVGLLLIATSDPEVNLTQTLVGAFVLAYGGATLDIAVDAWRIESAPNDEQANMAAVYIFGYRLAIMFAGVGLILASRFSWLVAYTVMAGAMTLVGGMVFLIREPERPQVASDTPMYLQIRDAIVQPFWQVVARFGRWVVPVLSLVAIYRLSDFTMGVMASPFYADLGYSKEAVGLITGVFGPWPIVAGGFLGGFVAVRFRLMPALLVGAVITLLTNGAFAALALAAGPGLDLAANGDVTAVVNTPPNWALLIVVVADNLAAGYVGTVFVAYLSSLTEREFAATQYALFSSAYSLFCKLAASTTSGPLAETVGWAGFYFTTALFAVPSALLIGYIMRYGPGHAKGDGVAA
ncbi:MAG: MFS transporter [Myxococcales bacterium]|nr:MFS transporter [Myxococcales bacterium]